MNQSKENNYLILEKASDTSILRNMIQQDDELLIATYNSLMKELPINFSDMKTALIEENWEHLSYLAHTVKSNLMMVGSVPLRDAVKDIESFARHETKLDQIPQLLQLILNNEIGLINELKEESETIGKEN